MDGENRGRQLDPAGLSQVQELDMLSRALGDDYGDDLYATALAIFDLGWRYGYSAGSESDYDKRRSIGGNAIDVAQYLQEKTKKDVRIDFRLQ